MITWCSVIGWDTADVPSPRYSRLSRHYRPNPTLGADWGILPRRFPDGKTKDYDLFFVSSPPFHSDTNSLVPIHPLPPSISVSPSVIQVFHLSTRYSGMANTGTDDHHEESSPLLSKQVEEDGSKGSCNEKGNQPKEGKVDAAPDLPDLSVGVGYGWTTEGLPLGHGNVVGEPMARGQWGSSLFDCFGPLGSNDEFCCSNLEVCILGYAAPCVLYGSNVERLTSDPQSFANQRLKSGPQTFANHCLLYCGLRLLGVYFCHGNWLAPCFSYRIRTALRRKFNLEGSCEALSRSCGCCGSCAEDEVQREQCESVCDCATHVFCHPCALCQEGREIRRRIPHPGFNAQPLLGMIPPGEQTMGRRA